MWGRGSLTGDGVLTETPCTCQLITSGSGEVVWSLVSWFPKILSFPRFRKQRALFMPGTWPLGGTQYLRLELCCSRLLLALAWLGTCLGYTAEQQAPPPRSASRGPAHFPAPGQWKQWVLMSVSSPLSPQKRVRVCNQAARTPGWVPNFPCGLVSDRMSAST